MKAKIQEDAEEKEKVMPFAVEGDSKGEGLLRKHLGPACHRKRAGPLISIQKQQDEEKKET